MAAFLFQIELTTISEKFVKTIPEHRQHISKLFAEGTILSYSVSASRDFIWCVINSEDEKEAMDIVASFPLQPFFNDAQCHPLLFHNTIPVFVPGGISLN